MIDRERMTLEVRRAGWPALALHALIARSVTCAQVNFRNIGVTLPWTSTYERQIAIDNVKGVVAGEQTVRLAGVIVGRMESVKLVNGHPVVTISIDPKYGPLYRNARLRLRPETPLDDMYLDIESRGTPSAGALPANEVLPAARTEAPVDISSVLDVFNADTRTRVKEAIDELGTGLGSQGNSFRQAIVELAPFLAAAKQFTYETAIRQNETARLIHNFGLVTAELAVRDDDVRELVGAGSQTLSELGGSEASIQQVIDQLPPTMSQLESTFATVRATADHLDPAFDALEPVAAALPAGLRGLSRFSVAAEPAFAKLREPLPQLNALIRALRPTASGLRSSFDALEPVPSRLNYITQLVLPCEDALAKFFQNTISVGKFQAQYGVIIRGETVVGSNSVAGLVQDPDLTAAKSCAPGGPGG